MTIYNILYTKPHNIHYLTRYVKFIQYCSANNNITEVKGIAEYHHILPKGNDLFPEYKSFKTYPDNKVTLTYRQHFIAHRLLWKAYGGSQTYAFYAMCGQNNRRTRQTASSATYAVVKKQAMILNSIGQKGKANYRDLHGNSIRCVTTDPRVLSGELVSIHLGRTHSPRSQVSKDRTSRASKATANKKWPTKKTKLYFMDIRIVLTHSTVGTDIVHYLDQGWSLRATPEFNTKIGVLSGKRIRTDAEKAKSSNDRKGKTMVLVTAEVRSQRLEKRGRAVFELYYNPINGEYITLNRLLVTQNLIKVFSNGRAVYDINVVKRQCDNRVPTPNGWYDGKPNKIIRVFDIMDKHIKNIQFYQLDTTFHIIICAPNNNRITIVCDHAHICIQKEIITAYGIPLNCTYLYQ